MRDAAAVPPESNEKDPNDDAVLSPRETEDEGPAAAVRWRSKRVTLDSSVLECLLSVMVMKGKLN